MFTIRPCEAHHYEAVARIQNAIRPEPTTAAEIRRSDDLARSHEGATLVRVVAEAGGEVVGFALVKRTPWLPDGMWAVTVQVDPAARGQGCGRALYAYIRQVALEGGARALESWVLGTDEESFAWARRRGFSLDKQRTESVLDLTTFDLSRFAGVKEKVEGSGLRLWVTAGEVDDALLRQIWELDCITSPDVPIWDPNEKLPTFEEYRKDWRDQPTPPIVAGCFDGDRLVGVSILWLPQAPGGGAYTGYTGVYREYRGRSIALALKLLTIEEAIRRGIGHMRTNNDPDNPAMLAVNAKLGYRLVPGPRRLRLTLS